MKKFVLHSLFVMLVLSVCFNMDVADKRITGSLYKKTTPTDVSCTFSDGCRGRVIAHLKFVSSTSSFDLSVLEKRSPVLEKNLATYIFSQYEFMFVGFDSQTYCGVSRTVPLPVSAIDDLVFSQHKIIV